MKNEKQCPNCLEKSNRISRLFSVEILDGQVNLACSECGFGIIVLRYTVIEKRIEQTGDVPEEVKQVMKDINTEIGKAGWRIKFIEYERVQ